MSISEYLASIRSAVERLDTYGFAESILFQEEIRAGKQAIIKAKIVLVDGSCLIIERQFQDLYSLLPVEQGKNTTRGRIGVVHSGKTVTMQRRWKMMLTFYVALCT